jgi:hypothetical protein
MSGSPLNLALLLVGASFAYAQGPRRVPFLPDVLGTYQRGPASPALISKEDAELLSEYG